MNFLVWIESTDLSVWVRESDFGYPLILCAHAVGMAIVVGISALHAARVFGFSRDFPLAGFERLMGVAWFGFVLNAASGTLLLVGQPRRLLMNPAFQIKMLLIVFAGFAVWQLARALEQERLLTGGRLTGATRSARIAAVGSVVFWVGAIIAGRVIGYTIGPPPL
jgi:hypothetical protein